MLGRLTLLALVLMSLPAGGAEPAADPLPVGAVARLGSTRLRPLAPARAVAFSPDGTAVATASEAGVVQVWDPATGRQRWYTTRARDTEGGGPWGPSVAWSADGCSLIVPGEEVFYFLDPATGARQRAVGAPPHGDRFRTLAVSADGRLLYTSRGGWAVFWDAENARELYRAAVPNTAVMRPDDRHLLLAASDGRVRLVDWWTGKRVRTLRVEEPAPGTPVPAADEQPPALAVSGNGKLAAVAGAAPAVTLFALPGGETMRRIDLGSSFARALALTPDGRLLAVALGVGVRVFAASTGDPLRRIDRPAGPFAALAFAPDGRRLAGVGADGSLHLWDVTDGREVCASQGHAVNVQALVWLTAGRLASWDAAGRLIVWDPAAAAATDGCRDLKVKPASLAATADGRGVQGLGEDAEVQTWRPGTLPRAQRPWLSGPADRAVALGGGRYLVFRKLDGSLWARGPGAERALPVENPFSVDHIVFSPDTARVAGESGGRPVVWDRQSGRVLSAPVEGPVRAAQRLLLAPDGRSLVLHFPREVRVVEVLGGDDRLSLGGEGVTALCYSPDGRRLALGGEDGTVRVHDTATGRELMRRNGGQGAIAAVAFSPDGRLLASGGLDGLVLVWQAPAPPPRQKSLPAARRWSLWDRLAGDAAAAAGAMAELCDAPAGAVELVRQHLAELVQGPDAARMDRLIRELDGDEFEVRERAQKELAAVGAAAEDRLRKALRTASSPELRRRLQRLLAPLREGAVATQRLRAVRAVEVLEHVGTPAARRLLEELAAGASDPRVVLEIRDGLRRLGGRANGG
jgi:WD40 repeat protein